MSMFHAAMSASVIGLPSFGASAAMAADPKARTSPAASVLRVKMLDLPVAADTPAREAVVVLVGEHQRVGDWLLGLAAQRDELLAQRLSVAGLIPRSALQHGGLAVPAPRHLEAHERLRMHGA